MTMVQRSCHCQDNLRHCLSRRNVSVSKSPSSGAAMGRHYRSYLRRGLAQGQAESELQGGGGPEDTAVTAAGSTATWSWCPSPGKHWPVAPLGPLPLRSQVSTRLLHCKATFVPIKKRLSQFLNLSKIVFSSFRVHRNCFAYH